jgi:hypothetical protein
VTPTSQFRLLVRTFFDDFVSPRLEDGEEDDRPPMMPYILGMLIGPAAFFCCYELPRYADIRLKLPLFSQQGATIEAKFFLTTFTIVAVGFFMAWRWDSLFVDERDYLILASLPVTSRTIFAAKFTALLLAVGVIVACVNIAPAIAYPAMATVGGVSAPASYLVHTLVTLSAAVFTFAFFLGLQTFLLTVFSYSVARRLAPLVQLVSSAALAFMFLISLDASAVVAQVQRSDLPLLRLLPTYWFVGLYQQLLGRSDSVWHAIAVHAEYALAAAVAICVLLLPLTYVRHMKQVLEAKPGSGGANASLTALARLVTRFITRTPEQRAGSDFVFLTLLRSHRHRLVLAAAVAIALAFSLRGGVLTIAADYGSTNDSEVAALSAPLIISFFVMLGSLWAMTMPTGGRARWIFELAAEGRRAGVVAGARRAFVALSLGVPLLVALPLFYVRFNIAAALLHLATTMLLVALASALARRLIRSIPFVRTEQRFSPPQLSLVFFALWFAFTVYACNMARLELWIAHSRAAAAVFCAVLLAALACALLMRIVYEDPLPDWWRKEEGLMLVEVDP